MSESSVSGAGVRCSGPHANQKIEISSPSSVTTTFASKEFQASLLSELLPNPPPLFDAGRIGELLSRSGLHQHRNVYYHLIRHADKEDGEEVADYAPNPKPWVDLYTERLNFAHRRRLGREAQLYAVHGILHSGECAELVILAESIGFEWVASAPCKKNASSGTLQEARRAARTLHALLFSGAGATADGEMEIPAENRERGQGTWTAAVPTFVWQAAELGLRNFAAPLRISGLQRHSRCMFWCEDLAEHLFERLEDSILRHFQPRDDCSASAGQRARGLGYSWSLCRLNPTMSILKYDGEAPTAEHFKIHFDKAVRQKTKLRFFDARSFLRDDSPSCYEEEEVDEQSFFTVLLYLSSLPAAAGGGTRFCARYGRRTEDQDLVVEVESGKAVIFEHGLQHAGDPLVTTSTPRSETRLPSCKYVLRTDVMYVKVPRARRDQMAVLVTETEGERDIDRWDASPSVSSAPTRTSTPRAHATPTECKMLKTEKSEPEGEQMKKKKWLLRHFCPIEDRLGVCPHNARGSSLLGYQVVRGAPSE